MYIIKNKNIVFSIIAFLGITLSACKKDPVDWYRPTGTALHSYVKYINAIPKSTLDFYLYYTEMVDTVKFGDDQPYLNSPYGGPTIFATNNNNTSNRITLATGGTTQQAMAQGFVADFYQTVIACKANDSTNAETMILLRDDLMVPSEGSAHVRFVYLTQRGETPIGNVDLKTVSGPGGATTLFPSLSYRIPSGAVVLDPDLGLKTPGLGVYTSGPYTPVPAGEYTFSVSPTDGGMDIVTSEALNIQSGKIYTMYTSGKIGDTLASPSFHMIMHN